jgi:hypothetical protein
MWVLIFVQLFVIVLFLILGWAIRSKKKYSLLSGFATRSKEEQQELIENGFPQKCGALLQLTALGMLLLLPILFTDFKFAIELQYGFMLVLLLGGFVYLSKYEIPRKRKRSYIISTIFLVVTLSFVVGLYILGYQDYNLVTKKDTFEITGMYGDEWELENIQQIELLEKMPKVLSKQNGFGMATMAKGHFNVKGYGSSLLFINKDSSPYLYIELKNKRIFINNEDSNQTKKWYEELSKTVETSY